MESGENDDVQTDRSSTSSTASHNDLTGHPFRSNNDRDGNNHTIATNGLLNNHDSLSDEELSDFSMNYSDDEDSKTNSGMNGKWVKMFGAKSCFNVDFFPKFQDYSKQIMHH